MPPVSAQSRKELAVQLRTADADDDCLSPQREVTLAAVPASPSLEKHTGMRLRAQGDVICALGNLNADFEILD